MLVAARKATYTPKNILSVWPNAGLIRHNPRHVLNKLILRLEIITKVPQPDPVYPPTLRNTAKIHRKFRQATL